jgi:electron transfer flavoprotein beta subunit
MKAKKKEIKVIDLKSLGIEPAMAVQVLQLDPVPERTKARIIGGTAREATRELVRILREEEKVLE